MAELPFAFSKQEQGLLSCKLSKAVQSYTCHVGAAVFY